MQNNPLCIGNALGPHRDRKVQISAALVDFFQSLFGSVFDTCLLLFSDIEVANRHGHTCLMIACYKGHLKIAKYLIDAKADVNRKSVKGNTALHDCAESGSLEIMKLLLTNGAKIDVDAYGKPILLFCCNSFLCIKSKCSQNSV